MNTHLKEAFSSIKPICDMVMVNPSPEHITAFTALVGDLKMEILQELQQYMLFPFITHLQSKEMETKYEMQKLLTDSMKEVLQKVTVTSLEMCMKIEMGLLTLVFEKPKPGMIADAPEELKLSVMQCLTVLMLRIDEPIRIKMLENQVPLLAQAVFVSVHLAKLEKLRTLRLAALTCLLAHTGCHPALPASEALQAAARGLLACILPGVLAALQDVAMASDQPGHAVVVAALNATHLVLCLTMHNKHVTAKTSITAEDFVAMLSDKAKPDNDVSKESIRDSRLDAILAARDYHSLAEFIRDDRYQSEPPKKEKKSAKYKKARAQYTNNPKNVSVMDKFGSHEQSSPNTSQNTVKTPSEIPKRSSEWYAMASEKLAIVVKSLIPLVSHEHYKVRKELAVLCHRIVTECSATMQPSLTMALDVLISLSNDDYNEVSEYCAAALKTQFENPNREALDGFCENFFTTLNCLPRILNNIDDNRKLSVLNLLSGYLGVLCDGGRPQRLTAALSAGDGFHRLCEALLAAADIHTDLSLTADAGESTWQPNPPSPEQQSGPLTSSVCAAPSRSQPAPWRRPRHLSPACSSRLQRAVAALAQAECGALLLDRLLELFHERRTCDLLYLINCLGSAPGSSPDLARRIIGVYISEDVWYQPLEVRSGEKPLTSEDTLDVTVYNPRAWTRDSVPDLFEGTIETRYTDISSTVPRVSLEPNSCVTLGQAQKNLTMCCLLTEGVGLMARRLGEDFQPYLLKTLCPLLERAGSRYPALRAAGLLALQHAAAAGGLASAGDLVAANGDYYTSQVTRRLRKPWSVESALQILSVVMEYSDITILDYLYGIVEDVLLQSCDQYYENNLCSYLQVFNSFINYITKWFPTENTTTKESQIHEIDVLKDVIEFAHNKEEADRLLNTEEFEETGRSVEEMYQEDLKRREEEVLDYDDRVTQESPPPPRHILVTESVLRRCVHFVSSESREAALLALEALAGGLAALAQHPDRLLPLVHTAWAPLPPRLRGDALVARRTLGLVVVMADLTGDFIRDRASKDVVPCVCASLRAGARRSLLQDAGAAYRLSAAYALQRCALDALGALAARLELRGAALRETLLAGRLYLSAKQPKPLQMLAVKFFKDMLEYDYGGTWQHLRRFGNDMELLAPPAPPADGLIDLRPVLGTPYECADADYDTNVKLIFYLHK